MIKYRIAWAIAALFALGAFAVLVLAVHEGGHNWGEAFGVVFGCLAVAGATSWAVITLCEGRPQ